MKDYNNLKQILIENKKNNLNISECVEIKRKLYDELNEKYKTE
jgi:hypothetical protein